MGVRAPLAVRRALSEPPLLLAAFGSILLATTTLVALATYTSSVAEVGVRRAMENAPASTVATTITAPVRQSTFAGVERAVRARLAALAGSGGGPVRYDVRLSARSDSYALPGQERLTHPELTRFGVDEGLEGHARLMQGVWPRPAAGGVVEVAASQAAAQEMNLGVGDEFRVVGRLDDTAVRARLTGVFRLDDSSLGRWDGDELLRRGSGTATTPPTALSWCPGRPSSRGSPPARASP